MFIDPLPAELEIALAAIHENSDVALKVQDIKRLMLTGHITTKYGGGWMASSKGREYLKWMSRRR
jgi:hypothetical protein